MSILERALRLSPDHPGANHYYVHALEDAPDPSRALPSAARLTRIAPGVGHLVHMPAHVYFRLGRYADAALANENAIAADRKYLEGSAASPTYITGYAAHNYHFLTVAAMMSGNNVLAASAAAALEQYVSSLKRPLNGTEQHYVVLPLYVRVRFGNPATPPSPSDMREWPCKSSVRWNVTNLWYGQCPRATC